MRMSPFLPLAERFALQHVKADGDACWQWTGGCNSHGYGSIRDGARGVMGAHKVAWELERGPVPDGLQVCHHCDNRRCVRVSHMFLGTIQDNMADRNAKGRQARGWSIAQHRIGRPLSDEARAKISAAHLGRPHAEEHRRNLAEATRRNAKLTWEKAEAIRSAKAAGSSLSVLASKYGVSVKTIHAVVQGLIWKQEAA